MKKYTIFKIKGKLGLFTDSFDEEIHSIGGEGKNDIILWTQKSLKQEQFSPIMTMRDTMRSFKDNVGNEGVRESVRTTLFSPQRERPTVQRKHDVMFDLKNGIEFALFLKDFKQRNEEVHESEANDRQSSSKKPSIKKLDKNKGEKYQASGSRRSLLNLRLKVGVINANIRSEIFKNLFDYVRSVTKISFFRQNDSMSAVATKIKRLIEERKNARAEREIKKLLKSTVKSSKKESPQSAKTQTVTEDRAWDILMNVDESCSQFSASEYSEQQSHNSSYRYTNSKDKENLESK
jgi:hypothetical protein